MPDTRQTNGDTPADSPRPSLFVDLLVVAGGIVLTGMVRSLWNAPPVVLLASFLVASVAIFSCYYRRWALALAFMALTVVLLLPAKPGREAPRRLSCRNNLKQIGLALHNYHDQNGCFPPPYVADAKGKPFYSWRVLLLPYLEENRLYEQWRLDEPWDSLHNRPLAEQRLKVFQCPSAEFGSQPLTSYLAVVGPGMAWEHGKCLTLEDFADDASTTIMVVEVRDSQVHWAEPVDMDRAAMSLAINDESRLAIGSRHQTVANVLFVDGSAMALPNDVPEDDVAALLTRGGGESIDRDALETF